MMKAYRSKHSIWIRAIAMAVICLFLVNDIVWAQPNLAKSTLSPQSRLRPFFEKHGLGFQNIATVIMAASELKNLIVNKETREGAIYTKIEALNNLFQTGEVEIEKKILSDIFKCSGKEYKYAVFHFKKQKKTFNVLFFEDHAALTPAELAELRIRDTEKYHLDCPGLEGVWFINSSSQPIIATPMSSYTLGQGGTMGRWKYTHTTLTDVGILTLHNATRIPRKDGIVEEEFLMDGQNKPRDIVLQTRKLTNAERGKISGIRKELGIDTEPRVIIRNESAIHNRIYGVTIQGELSQAEINSKLSSLKGKTIKAVEAMARSGQADIKPIVELARQIYPNFDPHIPESQWLSVTPEMFIILNSALKYQIYLPNNEIFEIVRISEKPDALMGEIKKGSWRGQDYLKSKIWVAESSPVAGGYSIGGLTAGWFAVFNLNDFREAGKERYRDLKQSALTPGERYSSPYEIVTIPLIQIAHIGEEDFVEGVFVEHARQEEIRHAQDNSYVSQRLRKDNRYDPDEDEQTISEILKPDSTLRQRVFVHLDQKAASSETVAKLNRQLSSRIITEYSARLGGAIAEMKKHIVSGREELAFIAFLNFMEDQFLCVTPEQIPSDDILKLAYFNVAVLFFQDIDEWAGTPLDHNSIDVIRLLGMEPGKLPVKKALKMLEEIYAKHFWTDEERYNRLSSETFELASPLVTGIVAQGIAFVREDIIAEGSRGQIKEALDHENRELAAQHHDVIRREQYQGNLRSLVTQLSGKDKVEKEAKRIHAENLKYAPRLAANIVLCHIATPSTLPDDQQTIGMLNRLDSGMRGREYSEKILELKIDGSKDFIEQVKDTIRRAKETYGKIYGKDYDKYIFQFDVACPNLDLVARVQNELNLPALAFVPQEGEGSMVQVENIMLALRALRRSMETNDIQSLINAYRFITGNKIESSINDIPKFAKTMLFTMPKMNVNELGKINALIEENIKTAA